MATQQPITIRLTKQQQDIIRAACGRSSDAIELTVEQLEERIAPSVLVKGTGSLTDLGDGATAAAPDVCLTPDNIDAAPDPTPIDASSSEVGDDPASVKVDDTEVATKEDAVKDQTSGREPTAQEFAEATTPDEPVGIDDTAIRVDESGTTRT